MITMDLQMPVMNGMGAIRLIRQLEEEKRMKQQQVEEEQAREEERKANESKEHIANDDNTEGHTKLTATGLGLGMGFGLGGMMRSMMSVTHKQQHHCHHEEEGMEKGFVFV